MLLCRVVGFSTRPYSFDDSKTGKHLEGTTCKISVAYGDYPSDDRYELVGVGERYAEYKCPDSLIGAVQLGDTLSIELDDFQAKEIKIKSAMIKDEQTGFYMPVF